MFVMGVQVSQDKHGKEKRETAEGSKKKLPARTMMNKYARCSYDRALFIYTLTCASVGVLVALGHDLLPSVFHNVVSVQLVRAFENAVH